MAKTAEQIAAELLVEAERLERTARLLLGRTPRQRVSLLAGLQLTARQRATLLALSRGEPAGPRRAADVAQLQRHGLLNRKCELTPRGRRVAAELEAS